MAKPVVYVVSDSAGETGTSVVQAAAVQFLPADVDIRRVPFVGTPEGLDRVVESARRDGGLIVFTLVIPSLRDHLIKQAKAQAVPHIDVLGPILASLEAMMHREALHQPGKLHQLDADYFRKMEAVEFAVNFDDGRDPKGIVQADLVLVGVSRTSKTPLSMYLAHKTIKVANVPLVPELKPPEQLFKIHPRKIVGLTIDPEQLNVIRRERLKALGLSASAQYAQDTRIREEIAYAKGIMDKLGCEVIDVSNRAVEETAGLILRRFSGAVPRA